MARRGGAPADALDDDAVAHDPIVDNLGRRVGDALREGVEPGAELSVVSAYFTIYAYEALRDALESAGGMRFLYGEPQSVGAPDPAAGEGRSFRLNEEGGMDPKRVLAQKPLARACAAWIERCVEIRSVKRANFLHGKLYHVANRGGKDGGSDGDDGGGTALVGSSNFTRRGLGFGTAPNLELNLEVRDAADRAALIRWFDALWRDESATRDAKPEVLAALERLGRAYAPAFVYYKTLLHLFEDRLAERGARDGLLRDVHLHDTAIWKALYAFQKDGATSAINRLLRHGGCIVADSVGLGKTWTALAVIKFFELRNERVLVLCPKKLEENWVRYAAWAGRRNNPFAGDRLGYTVLAHTDLSRYDGRAGQIDLAGFHWGAFDLVVIDESHNFRNEGRDRTDETGRVARRSRYNRLLEEAVKGGVRSKLLMLSATPVNTSLRDLRNQIYLMTEKRGDAFRETLGIDDVQSLFGVAQREFLDWERTRRAGGRADKAALIERLGADFLALLDAATIARSRAHLRRFYPEATAEIGGFPRRAPPRNLHPPTDRDGALSYDDLHERIGGFRLAVYTPSQYLLDASALDEEKARLRFDQRDRERFLIGMMRVNLLKRLESSAHAFALTMGRILDGMDALDRRIEAWRERERGGEKAAAEAAAEAAEAIESLPEEDEEDEEFAVGRGKRYRLDELDLDRWRRDLREDRRVLDRLRGLARQVTAARDAKLAALEEALAEKIANPGIDKDGRRNRKALVFTSFADTARYLYENLLESGVFGGGIHAALITGGGDNRSTVGESEFGGILARFAPRAQRTGPADGAEEPPEIDVLIATDCLSEGQNLQDCDLVVNYDVHWNPVRLMQRFGRIDRLGSRNRQVAMINFWPTADLDRYLNLKNRVEARMALADAAATGLDDPLDADAQAAEEAAQGELRFRDEQLKRLRDEILDIEDAGDGVNMSDLTLDDFLADLLQYIQKNRAALEAAPFGVYAVAGLRGGEEDGGGPAVRPGAIFCLKQRSDPAARTPNRLHPYFLVYVRGDGTAQYGFRQAGECLRLFRRLAAGRDQASSALEDAFDRETQGGRRMEKYEALIDAALRSIAGEFREAEQRRLGRERGARLAKASERPGRARDFELATWLVIAEEAEGGRSRPAR